MNVLTLITIFTGLLVLATISAGIYFLNKNAETDRQRLKKCLRINYAGFIPAMVVALILFAPTFVSAATAPQGLTDTGLAYLGAALSTGLACIGAGYAVGVVGSAALGAVSENEKILGKTLIYVGLAEGVAIYGLIIAIMIIGRL